MLTKAAYVMLCAATERWRGAERVCEQLSDCGQWRSPDVTAVDVSCTNFTHDNDRCRFQRTRSRSRLQSTTILPGSLHSRPYQLRSKCSSVYSSVGDPSQTYGASSAIWDHTVLCATRHRSTSARFIFTADKQAAQFTYSRGMQG